MLMSNSAHAYCTTPAQEPSRSLPEVRSSASGILFQGQDSCTSKMLKHVYLSRVCRAGGQARGRRQEGQQSGG
eukprot:1159320-Pelagomonas_calceolata.AAC.17